MFLLEFYCSSLICCLHSGARLVINSSWKNPSQEWHVGCKLIYELFTDTLISRLKVNFIFSAYTPKFLYWTWYLNKDLPTRTSERKKEEMGRGKPGSNFWCSEAAEWIWKGLGPFWLHLDSPLLPIVYFIVCTAFSLSVDLLMLGALLSAISEVLILVCNGCRSILSLMTLCWRRLMKTCKADLITWGNKLK